MIIDPGMFDSPSRPTVSKHARGKAGKKRAKRRNRRKP